MLSRAVGRAVTHHKHAPVATTVTGCITALSICRWSQYHSCHLFTGHDVDLGTFH